MQALERVSSKIIALVTIFSFVMLCLITLTQEGVKSDMVGALNLLADGLQKSGSEDRNLNEVMVIC